MTGSITHIILPELTSNIAPTSHQSSAIICVHSYTYAITGISDLLSDVSCILLPDPQMFESPVNGLVENSTQLTQSDVKSPDKDVC